MNAGAFASAIFGILMIVATAPLCLAYRQHNLFAVDLLLPVFPAVGFVLGLLQFNVPAQTGWAVMIYPFFVVAASVVLLYVNVYGLRSLFGHAHAISFAVLIFALTMATYLGATVSPWYE